MKKLFIFIIISTISIVGYSQRGFKKNYEVVYSLGATNFLGELGGANRIGTNGLRDFDFPFIKPCGGIGYRYKMKRTSAIKGNLYLGFLGGNDNLTKEYARNNRNLNFRAFVTELSCQYEYMFMKERKGHRYNLRGIHGWKNIALESYFFAGVGGFYFHSKGKYNGMMYSLKPLRTEGEGLLPTRKKYSSFQPCIPLGIGFKYAINRDWFLGLEIGIRKTFTDYIDDVSQTYVDPALLENVSPNSPKLANPTNNSAGYPEMTAPGMQRGDPRDKDAYIFGVITLYYKLKKGLSLPKF